MRIPLLSVVSTILLLEGAFSLAQAVDTNIPSTEIPAPATPATDAFLTQEQLDQMLALIALYPDPLLAQVLMASTYPGEVSEAVTWSKANPNAKGDDAVKQVAMQPWDPSVQSLVAFPQVLVLLGQDDVWVQRLGDAFLAQPDDVMMGIQRLRHQARAAGNLNTNQYQNVTVQVAAVPASATPVSKTIVTEAAPSTIIIQPADSQVVYVPSYNPTTAYGPWPYPTSQPVYYPPPPAYYPGQALMAGLAFGTGVAVIGALWGESDWANNEVDIDVNRYNNINGNNRITRNQNNWHHNPEHRDGVPYRDNKSREQYGRQLDGAIQRAGFRGDDPKRAQARENARNSMDRHGVERPATSNRQAQDQARAAQPRSSVENRMRASHDRVKDADRNTGDNQQARKQSGQNRRPDSGKVIRPTAGQRKPANSDTVARNNAFEGVRSPASNSLQVNRGRASQASAKRAETSRSVGRQISRPSSAPSRQRGGGRR